MELQIRFNLIPPPELFRIRNILRFWTESTKQLPKRRYAHFFTKRLLWSPVLRMIPNLNHVTIPLHFLVHCLQRMPFPIPHKTYFVHILFHQSNGFNNTKIPARISTYYTKTSVILFKPTNFSSFVEFRWILELPNCVAKVYRVIQVLQ